MCKMIPAIAKIALLVMISACAVSGTESDYRQALYLDDQGKADEAYPLFLGAAQNGHVRSQSHIGSMLTRGRGTGRNCEEGRYWLTKASDAGDKSASFVLSVLARSENSSIECGVNDDEMYKKYRERYEHGFQQPST